MNPWEKELIEGLRETVEGHVKKKKKEGQQAVIDAMERALDNLDEVGELDKEELTKMSEFQAKETFRKAVERSAEPTYWHYNGDY
jgi:hypothetical protein